MTAPSSTRRVQPIVVDRTGDHLGVLACAAAASALVRHHHPDQPEWLAWEADNVAKTVRRATPRAYESARASVDVFAEVTCEGARAYALLPHPADDLPRAIARMQVSGTELPREPRHLPTRAGFTVALNRALGMTTGKAAAQAAHAVHEYVTHHLTPAERARWAENPAEFRVVEPDWDAFRTLAAVAVVTIRDAGHTEIAPGSLTAVAVADVA